MPGTRAKIYRHPPRLLAVVASIIFRHSVIGIAREASRIFTSNHALRFEEYFIVLCSVKTVTNVSGFISLKAVGKVYESPPCFLRRR